MKKLARKLEGEGRAVAVNRIERLRHWMERVHKMMPWILKFLVN